MADTRGAIAPPIFLGEAFILKNVEAQENFRLKDVEALLLTINNNSKMVCFIVIKTGEILIPQNKHYEVSLDKEFSKEMLQHA